VPYAGVGLGGAISWLDIDDNLPLDNGATRNVNLSSTEVTFAYQGFAGLRYNFGNTALSLTYRATATGSPRWTLHASDGSAPGQLDTKDLLVHSVNLGFHVMF
jgi:hypothetical protein